MDLYFSLLFGRAGIISIQVGAFPDRGTFKQKYHCFYDRATLSLKDCRPLPEKLFRPLWIGQRIHRFARVSGGQGVARVIITTQW
jgi:hypothetical protein